MRITLAPANPLSETPARVLVALEAPPASLVDKAALLGLYRLLREWPQVALRLAFASPEQAGDPALEVAPGTGGRTVALAWLGQASEDPPPWVSALGEETGAGIVAVGWEEALALYRAWLSSGPGAAILGTLSARRVLPDGPFELRGAPGRHGPALSACAPGERRRRGQTLPALGTDEVAALLAGAQSVTGLEEEEAALARALREPAPRPQRLSAMAAALDRSLILGGHPPAALLSLLRSALGARHARPVFSPRQPEGDTPPRPQPAASTDWSPRRTPLSVVIPVHNSLDTLKDCIAALDANTKVPFHLIVVDNASEEATAAWLADLAAGREATTLVVNDQNYGFGPAINQAMALVETPYACLLNSDAFVEQGWDGPMLELLETKAAVGCVVPKILEEDGRLQEAGVALSGDGRTWDVGNGMSPEQPEYCFRHSVDYGSGVCLMTRSADFAMAAGFDPVFGKAYYEDVDLCLRMWEMGLATVYEPRSQVRHVRGASSKGEEVAAMLETNRGVFAQRWNTLLRHRPVLVRNDEPPNAALRARDARCDDAVLIVAPPPGPGRSFWAWLALAKALAHSTASLRVTFLPSASAVRPAHREELWEAGVECLPTPRSWARWLQERAGHYALVITGTQVGTETAELLRLHQSRAEHYLLRTTPAADDDTPLLCLVDSHKEAEAGWLGREELLAAAAGEGLRAEVLISLGLSPWQPLVRGPVGSAFDL